MLYDVLIRLTAAVTLGILINAEGIATRTVAMSICVFLFLEVSVLLKKRANLICVGIGYLLTVLYLLYQGREQVMLRMGGLVLSFGMTALMLVLYYKMTGYYEKLHRTRDDSEELERLLKRRNQQLLRDQDQQIHLATLTERNRIAREIHDNVGHMLSRAILLLGAIQTVNSDEGIRPQLELLARTLDDSMKKMRESVHDLHDDSIDLEKNFQEILGELKDFRVELEADFEDSIPRKVKLSLIGILQEAVTNIVKHSSGDQVRVIYHSNPGFCTLSVTDNGMVPEETKALIRGESVEKRGIGLSNITDRARNCGGDAYFYTDRGFTVYVRLGYDNQ
ncbi:MAG: histidine kinase [Candidatus Weimeria sp.]|nr:sensor histidine kinase [Lachnospiraceae bacterium]MEE3354753.1 histidine kinase [Candidatus Weimeria sp.]